MRVAQIIELLLESDHRLSYLALDDKGGGPTPWLRELAQRQPRLALCRPFLPARRVPADFDVLYLSNLWSTDMLDLGLELVRGLRQHRHPAPLIYDAMDCLFKSVARFLPEPQQTRMIAQERQLHAWARASVFVSPQERGDAAQAFGTDCQPYVVGQFVRAGLAAGNPFADRLHYCFVGTPHASNLHGLSWFLDRVMPQLSAELDEVEFHILGRGMEALNIPVAWRARVKLLGYVEDLSAALARYRLQVVPIQLGSGIRIKLLDGMAGGTPAVSTSMGLHGLEPEAASATEVADGPAEFAAALSRLHGDVEVWERRVRAGLAYVQRHHARAQVKAQFAALLAQFRPARQ